MHILKGSDFKCQIVGSPYTSTSTYIVFDCRKGGKGSNFLTFPWHNWWQLQQTQHFRTSGATSDQQKRYSELWPQRGFIKWLWHVKLRYYGAGWQRLDKKACRDARLQRQRWFQDYVWNFWPKKLKQFRCGNPRVGFGELCELWRTDLMKSCCNTLFYVVVAQNLWTLSILP